MPLVLFRRLRHSNVAGVHKIYVVIIAVLSALVFGFIAGYQLLGEGRDFSNYLSFYNKLVLLGYTESIRFEYGFVFVASFFQRVLNADVELFLAFLASLALIIKFTVFLSQRRPLLTLLFYLFCFYPLHEYTQIRLAVAMSLILLASEQLFKHNHEVFFVLIGLACLFHASSLTMLVSIPLASKLASFPMRLNVVVLLGLGVSTGFLFSKIIEFSSSINPLVSRYSNNVDDSTVNLFSTVNILTVALLILILLARSLPDRRSRAYFLLVLFGIALMIAFREVPVFSHRLREMFLVFLAPLAFNTRLTPLGIIQMCLAVVLGTGYLYAHIKQSVIFL